MAVRIRLFQALIVLMSSTVATAVDIQLISNDPDNVYIDMDSIVRHGERVELDYVLDVLAALQSADPMAALNVPGAYDNWVSNKVSVTVDCVSEVYWTRAVAAYDQAAARGNMAAYQPVPASEHGMGSAVRGSTMKDVLREVCR
jgi:hypothetical protein